MVIKNVQNVTLIQKCHLKPVSSLIHEIMLLQLKKYICTFLLQLFLSLLLLMCL